MRRAAAEGLIHGERLSERRFTTTLREEAYLRIHWPLLSSLRLALRTEPNVRAAVLFGSFAVGQESLVDPFVPAGGAGGCFAGGTFAGSNRPRGSARTC